jgi:hypothetical protein
LKKKRNEKKKKKSDPGKGLGGRGLACHCTIDQNSLFLEFAPLWPPQLSQDQFFLAESVIANGLHLFLEVVRKHDKQLTIGI